LNRAAATTSSPPPGRRGARVAEALAAPDERPSAVLRRWPRLLQPAVVDRLIEAARSQLRIDACRSSVLAEAAAVIAERLDDRARLGRSFRARANALSVAGDNRAAADLHDRALALLETHGGDAEIARTLAASIQPLILLGDYDRARAAADRARGLYESAGDALQLARLEINVGNIHQRQDRGEEALVCYERAYEKLVRVGDVDGMFTALHNQAVTLIGLNRFRDAADTCTAARELACQQERPLFVVQADYNAAWLYYLRGEYSRAIDMLHATADISRQSGDGYHAALCLVDLSEIYLELNLTGDARQVAEEATERFRALGMRYETAKAIANTAIAYGQEGKVARAVELFADARTLFIAENNRIWASLVDLYQALLFLNEGRLFEARRLAHAALETFSTPALSSKRALCELLLARINLRLDNARAARMACERLLVQADGDRPIVTFHAYFLLGQAQAALGDRTGAIDSYRAGRAALEGLRSQVRGEELKIAFVENKLEVYERLVELLLDDEPSAEARVEAFRCIEEAKSRTLLDLIFRPAYGADRPSAGESELARSIRGLREELNSYYHLIEREQLQPQDRSPARIVRFRRQIGERERELARVLRETAATDSRQSELHAPRVFTVDEVRAALPADVTLVEFFQTRDRIVVCTIDRERVDVAPIAVTADVVGHVRLLQFQLSKFRLGAAYLEMFGASLLDATRAHLRMLFRELLAPIWPGVRGRHLVIVPHGMLHYVPFHALIDGDAYVADTTSVSYAPSASIYALCERQPPVTSGASLVLGVPDERAPFIEDEAEQVAAVLPGARLFVGEAATSDALRAHGPSSRIVHIASHADFRPESPMFSGVRLSDGYLNVHDLYHLELSADLVTLSGCGTGASVAAPGDERLGISRGLFLAGARRILVSLWDVSDSSTARFMTHLYGLISAGTPVVQALGTAMREIRRERPHPYYWAPFALEGKCGPL
jgi:tetratricopeptide (TPR) repeat protein